MAESSDIDVYKRMLERERKARHEAESYLEQKSLDLYEANQRLREASALYRRDAYYLKTILDSATDGILTIDAKGKVEKANPSASRIFGLTNSQIVGSSATDLVTTDTNAQKPTRENHYYAQLCTTKQPTVEAIGKRSDGELIEIELSASHGEIDGAEVVTWVLRDISLIRAVQRQAAISQRMAGIGELAAGIAHEINTPVQFVHENTKFLSEAFEAMERVLNVYETHSEQSDTLLAAIEEACPPEKLEYFRSEAPAAFSETKAGAQRIAKIVSAVKEFSHPGVKEKLPVDLNRAAQSARTVTTNHWKDVAEFQLNLADEMPGIEGFPAQINQVLVNLIVNAADAIAERMQNGDPAPGVITVTTGVGENSAFVSVADTGIGVDQENLERVFLPFYTTKPVGKGTGQGLAITHSIVVDNHKGSVDIKSTPGEGSVFTIRLPITAEATHKESA